MSKIDVVNLTVNLSYAEKIVTHYVNMQEPLMMWGPPGIGKSDLVRAIGEKTNRQVIDIRLSLFESVDLKGYPYIDDETKKMRFSITNELPSDLESNAILFLDEINASPVSTQQAAFQLILDRQIGEYKLPKGVSIIAAGNRETDKSAISEMPKPLQNRFGHIEVEADFNTWLQWAINNGIHPNIVGFLSNFPDRLFQFDGKTSSRSFATPRSWSKASTLVTGAGENIDKSFERDLVASCVGIDNAHEYVQFTELMKKVPNLDKILDGEDIRLKEHTEKQLGLNYGIITSVLYRLKKESDGIETKKQREKFMIRFDNFFKFILNNQDQIGIEFFPMICSACSSSAYDLMQYIQIKDLPHFAEILKQNKDALDGFTQDFD